MVESTLPINYQSLEIIKQLKFENIDKLIENRNEKKIELDDPLFMQSLGATLQSLCETRKGYGLSAVAVGFNSNFIVVSSDGKNFRYFYDLNYEKIRDFAQSLEACISSFDENDNPRRFLCYRSQQIRITGFELVNAKIKEVDEEVFGVLSAVIQHECENSVYNFLPNYGIEVQVS